MQFEEFPKIGRLTRECVITEKIDGTNAQVCISGTEPHLIGATPIAVRGALFMFAGSRTRYISPDVDNHGFARWAADHSEELWALGEGRHFGEWWGSGVQRGYGLPKGEKRFSLFNVSRWADERDREKYPTDRPACCHVVPELYRGLFSDRVVDNMIARLRHEGSLAAPGFMRPEGVVVFHVAAGVLFKKTLENDEAPKSAQRSQQQSPVGVIR